MLCNLRILRVLVNVRTKINTSNNADASHAEARSEHRTTIFQNLNRGAENVERNGRIPLWRTIEV